MTTAPTPEAAVHELQRKLARVEKRCRRLACVLRLLFVLLRVLKPDLSRLRFAGTDKARLLRAVDRTRGVLGLGRALSLLGLSLSRFHAWARLGLGCQLDDQPSCPVSTPQRLTASEVMAMREMATSESLRHVPTGRLALLAQRMSRVFASTSTWYSLAGAQQTHQLAKDRTPTLGGRLPLFQPLVHLETESLGVHQDRLPLGLQRDAVLSLLLGG